MYVHNMSIISWVAVAARWSNAEPAYKADPASLPPVVLWRLSLCLLHSCINILIHNKTLKVNYIKKFSLLNKSTLLITSAVSCKTAWSNVAFSIQEYRTLDSHTPSARNRG